MHLCLSSAHTSGIPIHDYPMGIPDGSSTNERCSENEMHARKKMVI